MVVGRPPVWFQEAHCSSHILKRNGTTKEEKRTIVFLSLNIPLKLHSEYHMANFCDVRQPVPESTRMMRSTATDTNRHRPGSCSQKLQVVREK